MTITATVLGVRIWPQSKGVRRVVSVGWPGNLSEEFPMRYTADIEDNIKEFDLGDVVEIQLTLAANQTRTT
jgi:hypothetical protein